MQDNFLYHLYDTLVLLGADKDIADMATNRKQFTEEDVNKLRNYNCTLVEGLKTRLFNAHTITIRTDKS